MPKKWEEKQGKFEKIRLIPEAAEEYNNLEVYKDVNDRKNG